LLKAYKNSLDYSNSEDLNSMKLEYSLVKNELKELVKFSLLGEYLSIIFSYEKLEIEEEKEVNRLLQDPNIEKNQLIMINFVERWKEERNKLKYQKSEQIKLLFQLIKQYELALFQDNLSNYFYFEYKNYIYYIDNDKVKTNFSYSDFTSIQIKLSECKSTDYTPVAGDMGRIKIQDVRVTDIQNCLCCGGEHKSAKVINNLFNCPNNAKYPEMTYIGIAGKLE